MGKNFWAYVTALCLLCLHFCSIAAEKMSVRYPSAMQSTLYSMQDQYFAELLALALDKAEADYTFARVDYPDLVQSRSLALLKRGHYDVHWLTTTRYRESQLQPVRIPLFKGLLGLRLGFVHKDNPAILADLMNLADLQKKVVGQGHDWPDAKVLKHAGFRLVTATSSRALLDMLEAKRIDYFLRSVTEIWHESAWLSNRKIEVDKHIAVYYPEAVYFFVQKGNDKLHDLLKKGLLMAIEDGSFQQLFDQYYGKALSRAKLTERKIFRVANPFMSAQTPVEDPRLWITLPPAQITAQ